jgi:hypothetical protein
MSSFQKCCELEALSRAHIQQHLLREMVHDGRFVRVEKGPMARAFQLTSGDYVVNSDELTAYRIEHKCEYTNKYGNFWLETFSNKSRGKLGWLFTNQADFLLYHFMREGQVYLVSLPALRRWLYSESSSRNKPIAHRYPHRMQVTHAQMNDTWGYCVPIVHVQDALKVRTYEIPPLRDEGRENAAR